MFKLDGGWVGQDQFERSHLEIRTEKWTLPYNGPYFGNYKGYKKVWPLKLYLQKARIIFLKEIKLDLKKFLLNIPV